MYIWTDMRSLLGFFLVFSMLSVAGQAFYEGPSWQQNGELTYTAFGWSMSNAGDVNGDGYHDMIVSAIDYSNPEETNGEEGKLFLYYGGPDGLATEAAWEFESDNDSSVLGFSTSGGDLNGDGFSDVVAGCLQWTGDQYNEGRIYLWYGSAEGLNPLEPDWTLDFDQVFALLGSGVALDGDINGDGYNDLFLSAKMWDEPEIEEGKTWLYWGSPDGPVASDWSWQANQEGAISGFPVSYAGDVNADGFDDVIIGANQYDYDLLDDGLAVTFYGSAEGLTDEPDWMMSSGQKKCNFGHWVDGAGDVNGDGYDDVIVAALLYESDLATGNEGRVFVYHGSADGLENTLAWYGEINQLDAQLGYSCAGAGDINADGYDDVIAGAKYWTNGELNEGGAFVWFGSADGLENEICFSAEGNQAEGYFGRHVSGDADFNNDGYSDIMVGAYRYSEILEADGKAFVYNGAPRPADFYFEEDTFCIDEINPIPVITGFTGGVFSSTDVIINSETGEINLLATSFGGPFTVTYVVDGYCSVNKSIWIQDANAIPIFLFENDSICLNGETIFPEILIPAIGAFSSDDIIIDAVSGAINTDTVEAGWANVIYAGTTSSGCDFSDTVAIYFQQQVEISLEKDTFCVDLIETLPIVNIPDGFYFSADADMNVETGIVNLSSTGAGGPYTVYYNVNAVCPDASATFYIDSADNNLVAFEFVDDSICINEINPVPVITGLTGGLFSSTTAVLNDITGAIDLGASDTGWHVINYEMTTASGCNLIWSDSIVILDIPLATFGYPADTLFVGDENSIPEITGLSGEFTSDPATIFFADAMGGIDLINSAPGDYTVYNMVVDTFCNNIDSTNVVILPFCGAPENILVEYYNSNSIIISWDADDFYSEYIILVINGDDTITYSASENNITISELLPETNYTIVVITNCTSTRSNAANPINVTTAALSVDADIIPFISIYPNPTNETFFIESEILLNNCNIALYGLDGTLIFEQQITSGKSTATIKTQNVSSGMYIIQLNTGGAAYYRNIIIK
jgi:hypothetical protein